MSEVLEVTRQDLDGDSRKPVVNARSLRAARLLLSCLALLSVATVSGQTLPQDAGPPDPPPCKVTQTDFNKWFRSGSASANGEVKPADSLSLDTSNNCNFYRWSQQMFLWLTSPAAGSGGSGRVFDSGIFYEVSTETEGERYFTPHTKSLAGRARRVSLRHGKPGPNGLPAVIDRLGRIIELVPSQLDGEQRQLLLNEAGQKVAVAKVTVTAEKRAVFFDAAGNVIPHPKLILPATRKHSRLGQRFFTADNTPIIVGLDGAVYDVSPAQAFSSAVLLAQRLPSQEGFPRSAVVYYSIVTNNVFTYFTSGVKSGKISATQFPTKQADLDRIKAAYPKGNFTDGNALAVEVKLAWVNVAAVRNRGDYITTKAKVPIFRISSENRWQWDGGEEDATLALVGVHFVGSAKGHPEMIWSTFEHFGNTPNGPYEYVNTSGKTVTVPADSAGNWLFSKTGSTGPFNIMHAQYDHNRFLAWIKATNGPAISPSDTQRSYPFGVRPTTPPNQEDDTPADSNTQIITINNSVIKLLAQNDVRRNYYLIGSTWTFGGFSPTGPFPNKGFNQGGAEIGTAYLANSTMETYFQARGSELGSNCFSCHNDGGASAPPPSTPATTAVSLIFDAMQPLRPEGMTAATKKK